MTGNYFVDTQSLKKYEGLANASFGELLQGVSVDKDDFLVTIPIDLQSKAIFYHDPAAAELNIFPKYKSKVKKFVELIGAQYSIAVTGTIVVESDIPEGKGLSSSTADMVAAFRAIENFTGKEFDREDIGAILRQIEPSDGVLYPGSVIYKHRKCTFVRSLGYFPATHIIAIDEGGVLDTISYNKVKKDYSEEDRMLYALLCNDLVMAFAANDIARVGIVATQSALMNQKYNNKKNLMRAISLLPDVDGLGVITTHSGTCIGIVLHPRNTNVEQVAELVKNAFPLDNVVTYKTI